MANFKIGTMLRVSADIGLKDFLGDKTLVNKGAKIWIGADNLAHYQDNVFQKIQLLKVTIQKALQKEYFHS